MRALPGAQRYAGLLFAVNYAAFGVVMILFLVFEPQGLVGIWRRVQTYFLLWPFKHRPDGRSAQMTAPLLAVDKLEVVYQRAITARAGHLAHRARRARSSACSAPTAPARPRCCARSPASTASTTRGSPKARIRFKGRRIENGQPHQHHAARHRAGARAREGVSEPDGGREPAGAGGRAASRRAERRRREAQVLPVLPARSPSCASARRACCPAASGRCWRSPARWSASPSCCWSTSCRSASRRWSSRT